MRVMEIDALPSNIPNMCSEFGDGLQVYPMPDESMIQQEASPGDKNRSIYPGEHLAVTRDDSFRDGDVVSAILFDGMRRVFRIYQKSVRADLRAKVTHRVALLVPLNPEFKTETIASPEDGYIEGKVEVVIASRKLRTHPG